MEVVKWVVTSALIYEGSEKYENTLYYLEDTGEVFKGDIPYTEGLVVVDDLPLGPITGKTYIIRSSYEGYVWNGVAWKKVIEPALNDLNDTDTFNVPVTGEAIKRYITNKFGLAGSGYFIEDLTYDTATKKLRFKKGNQWHDVTIDLLEMLENTGDGSKFLANDGEYYTLNPDFKYTNPTPVPATLGGVTAGMTFNNMPLKDLLDTLLYPYLSPTFSTFTISGVANNAIEVGDGITNPTFNWGTINSSNIIANTIDIMDVTGGNILLADNIANNGSTSVVLPLLKKTVAATHQFKIEGMNTQNVLFNRTVNINWQWRRYFGASILSSLTEADIKALAGSELNGGFTGTYALGSGGYKYICYASSLGTASTFKDSSTGLNIPFEAPTVVPVTNALGITTNYNVHRSSNVLGASINIIVS